MIRGCLVAMICNPLDGATDVIRQRDHRLDVQLSTRDLAVLGVTRDCAARFYFREHRGSGRVVSENIERVLARVETRRACFDWAAVLERIADLELVSTTLHIQIEPFIGRYRYVRGYCF
jgi:hypothetical protein